MNNLKVSLYPLYIYLLLWLAVFLFSWLGSMYEFVGMVHEGGGTDTVVLQSMLSVESVRWMVRSMSDNVAAAPVGNVLMSLMAVGMMERSGLFALFSGLFRHTKLSLKQKRAAWASSLVFLLLLAIILLGLVKPWGILLGVTGTLSQSSFVEGLPFLVSILCCIPGIVYGVVCGRLHSVGDVLSALHYYIALFAGFFVTLFVATQLMASVRHSHIDTLLCMDELDFVLAETIIYWMPLLYLLVLHLYKGSHDNG